MSGKTNRYQTIALSLVFLLNITTFFYYLIVGTMQKAFRKREIPMLNMRHTVSCFR